MKVKQLAALGMGSLLALSMGVPAFAASAPTTKIKASCKLPEVRVSVPTTGKVYINPFKMKISGKIGGEDDEEQIISVPSGIANLSEVPIEVNVTVTGTVKSGSDMTLSTTSTYGSKTTAKKAFVFFQMQVANPKDVENNYADVSWDGGYNPKTHVLVTTAGKTMKNIVTLAAAKEDGSIAEEGVGAFRLSGDTVANPKNPWNSKDGLNVNIAFTFTPVSILE